MFLAGQQIGSYTLIEKIGRGGFGEVWLAEKRSEFITKKVAIKLPHGGLIDFEEIRKEAMFWEQASGHPNVLPLIDADVFNGQVAIVSEYAEGGSLADRLKLQGKLPIREAVEIIIGVLNGLEYLHSKHIIHRDIKPANILLRNNIPLLADFGISRALETSTTTSVVVGTENYMAPEAFEGARNVQTDIWSVGVVLYELLKGSPPFPQKRASEVMYAILLKEPEPLPDDIPPELQRIVFKALEKDKDLGADPPRRYQTAAEMRDDLKIFLNTFSQPALETAPVLQNTQPDNFLHSPTENFPLIPTHPQTDIATRVKLRIPVRYANGWRSFRENFLQGKYLPLVIISAIFLGLLGFAGILWIATSLFDQSPVAISNVSNANSNVSNSEMANATNSIPAEPSVEALKYAKQGYKLYTQRKFDAAIETYNKAIEISPQSGMLYNDRGLVYAAQRKYEQAIADFNKALELNPNDSFAYNSRGVTYEHKGDRGQAIADFQKALELDPNNKIAEENLKNILK
jgi:serine/threonine protein kinase